MKTYEFYRIFNSLKPEEKKRAEEFLFNFRKGIGPMNRDKWVLLVHLALQEGLEKLEPEPKKRSFFSRWFKTEPDPRKRGFFSPWF